MIISGEDANSKYFNKENRLWLAAPCLAKSRGGRLFCSFCGDNYVSDEGSNNYGKLLISDDGGKTWREDVVIHNNNCVRISEPNVWTAPDGSLWNFWCQQYTWWDGRGGLWASVCKNPDAENLVWSKPVRLCDGVMNSRPLVISAGRWLFPISVWKNIPSKWHPLKDRESTFAYYSDDCGQTLKPLGEVYIDDTSFDENQLAETADGKILMIVRCKDNIKQVLSSDGGATWERPTVMRKHCSSRSYIGRFPSGNLLHINCDDDVHRTKMTAFLSTDGGVTWKYKLLLDGRDGVSYPGGFIDEDGTAFIAHDRNRHTDKEICMSRFTERDIIEGKLTDKNSFLSRTITIG